MLSSMTLDDLNRLLTASKWFFGVLAVLTASAGLFNQWVSDRITKLQSAQKIETQKKLQVSEAELLQTKERTVLLEKKLAPRALTAEQLAAISESMKAFAGTQFQFVSYQDDAEVKGLVIPLIKVLISAGWKGLPVQEFLMAGLVEGVIVEYTPDGRKALSPAAIALAASLNAQGIQAQAQENPELKDRSDRVRVKVGKKPS